MSLHGVMDRCWHHFSSCLHTVRISCGLSYPTSWRCFAVRNLFWGGVLTLEFLVSMNGVRAMTTSLQMATQIFGTRTSTSMRDEEKMDGEMWKSMVYYKRVTKVR